MASEIPETVPGMPCPSCGHPIVVSLEQILSGEPIPCGACGLVLTVDVEHSRETLDDLRELKKRLAATQGGGS